MKRISVKQFSVNYREWKPTDTAITPYIDLLTATQLPGDKAERVVILLSGGKLTHRGFIRGVKSAIKKGHKGLEKYLPKLGGSYGGETKQEKI